jgi:hypothetical protein
MMLGHLWKALHFERSEILRADLFLGVAGGGGAAALAAVTPDALLRGVPVAAGLIGVIIGAVIASVAVQTAFMDQAFLRKLKAINREPVRYLAPFLFTAVISVGAMLGLIVLSTLSDKSGSVLLSVIGGLVGFLLTWAIVSLLYCLSTLVQFVGLKMDAVDVPDDIEPSDNVELRARGGGAWPSIELR